MASRSEPGCGRMGAGKWGASPLLPVLKRQHRDRRGIEGQQPIQDATSRNRQPAASNAMPEAGLDSRGGKGVWAYWVNNNATSLPCKAMGATGIAAASCTRWEKHTARSVLRIDLRAESGGVSAAEEIQSGIELRKMRIDFGSVVRSN